MKRFCLVLLTVCLSGHITAQNILDTKLPVEADSPEWIKLMMDENPNLYKVKAAYKDYYATHEFVKNGYTRYYREFVSFMEQFADADGYYKQPDWNPSKEQNLLNPARPKERQRRRAKRVGLHVQPPFSANDSDEVTLKQVN